MSEAQTDDVAAAFRTPKWRTILLVLGFVVFTYFAAVTATGNILGARAPDRVEGLTPVNGFALGRLANRELRPVNPESATGFNFDITDDDRPLDLAIAALHAEPTDTRAASVVATIRQLNGDDASSDLHEQVLGLSRRSIVSHLAKMDSAARAGDYEKALGHTGKILRVYPGTRENILPYLTTLLTFDEAVPGIRAMLAGEPEWRDEFWQLAPNYEPALDNLVKLREQFGPASDFRERRNDEFLLQALVNRGDFQQAETLAAKLSEDFSAASSAEPLRNADFSREPRDRPFDWRLFTDGLHNAALQTEQGQLIISASGGAFGAVASQLVRLGPGKYTLQVEADNLGNARTSEALEFRFVCSSNPTRQAGRFTLDEVQQGVSFSRLKNCEFYFLTLFINLPRSELGSDYLIENISLTQS